MFYQMVMISNTPPPPFPFYSNGSRETEAQGGNRESPGIHSVCYFVSFLLPVACQRLDWLFNDLVLWFCRSSLPFPDPDGYEVSASSYFSV